MTKEEFLKLPFSAKKWDQSGGDRHRRPFWQSNLDPVTLDRRMAVYVSATWYPDWTNWQDRAALAKDCASGTILDTPHYLIETAGDEITNIWVNVCCPSANEFAAAVEEARASVRERAGRSVYAHLAARRENAPSHPVQWCQANYSAGTIGDTF